MSDKTLTYHVSLTTGADGAQVPAMVFKKPVDGAVFEKGYIVAFNDAGAWLPANDDGQIPHRERTSDDEDLGLTWQFSK